MQAIAQQSVLKDPLAIAAIVSLLVVGIAVVVDLVQDGELNPTLLGLLVAVMGPLTPALIMRARANGNGNGK